MTKLDKIRSDAVVLPIYILVVRERKTQGRETDRKRRRIVQKEGLITCMRTRRRVADQSTWIMYVRTIITVNRMMALRPSCCQALTSLMAAAAAAAAVAFTTFTDSPVTLCSRSADNSFASRRSKKLA